MVGDFGGSDLETGLPLNLDSVALLQWPCDPRDATPAQTFFPSVRFVVILLSTVSTGV